MGLTTDPNDPGLRKDRGDGQNETYLVLSEEERAKGFVRPLRRAYVHKGIDYCLKPLDDVDLGKEYVCGQRAGHDDKCGGLLWKASSPPKKGCGTLTTMGLALCETYARDPKFYGATFCCGCGKHLPVAEFVWDEDGAVVGS